MCTGKQRCQVVKAHYERLFRMQVLALLSHISKLSFDLLPLQFHLTELNLYTLPIKLSRV